MLKPPYPFFGGKSRIADIVWSRFGNTPNYVEPFAGGLGVLLQRPHEPKMETVCDSNGFIPNFWRAVQKDPEGVAKYADSPVHESDFHAKHYWLAIRKENLTRLLEGNPDYYDVKIAGWWVWGVCCFLGGDFACGSGAWRTVDTPEGLELVKLGKDDSKISMERMLPHLGDAGRGVNRRNQDVYEYMRSLQERIRYVRVVCGDWSRVCTKSVTTRHGITGVFCMHPNTPIRLSNEQTVPVSTIEVGTRIHGGRTVKRVMCRNRNGTLLRLSLQGLPDDLCVTPEHRIVRIPKRPDGSKQDYRTNDKRWAEQEIVQASSIEVGDLVFVPLGGSEYPVTWEWSDVCRPHGTRKKKVHFNPTEGLFRLLGYYAAEGNIVKSINGHNNGVQFTFCRTELNTYVQDVVNLCVEIFGIHPKIRLPNPSVAVVYLGSAPIADFFSMYVPGTATCKKLHQSLMTAPIKSQEELLKGWLRGDGGIWHDSRNRAKLTGTSSSETLARNMMTLALRCGLRPSFKVRKNKLNESMFVCYDVYFASRDASRLGWVVSGIKDRCSRRIVNGYMLIHVRGVKEENYSGLVYDLDVDMDDLVVASGILIHNCDPPYGNTNWTQGLYSAEDLTPESRSLAKNVEKWVVENGDNPQLRIALCGYEGDYIIPDTWECLAWKANGGYGNRRKETMDKNTNRGLERIWFSPHCLKPKLASE